MRIPPFARAFFDNCLRKLPKANATAGDPKDRQPITPVQHDRVVLEREMKREK